MSNWKVSIGIGMEVGKVTGRFFDQKSVCYFFNTFNTFPGAFNCFEVGWHIKPFEEVVLELFLTTYIVNKEIPIILPPVVI